MDPLALLAAGAPLLVQLGQSLITRFVAPDRFKPASIDEYVKVQNLDLERFKALTASEGAHPSYPWVEAIIRLQRPLIGAAVLVVWCVAHLSTIGAGYDLEAINTTAGAVFFYLFGDRTLSHIRARNLPGK